MSSVAQPIEPMTNLGGTERDRRLRKGVIGATIALVVAVALVSSDVPWALRLLLFLPFFYSSNMVAMGLTGS